MTRRVNGCWDYGDRWLGMLRFMGWLNVDIGPKGAERAGTEVGIFHHCRVCHASIFGRPKFEPHFERILG